MFPDIRWITPLYGFGSDCEHIGVPESARVLLQEMADELVRTSGLVAIYIPEGTEVGKTIGSATAITNL